MASQKSVKKELKWVQCKLNLGKDRGVEERKDAQWGKDCKPKKLWGGINM